MEPETKSRLSGEVLTVAGEPDSAAPDSTATMRWRFTRRDFLRNSAAMPPLIAALFAAPAIVSCGDSSSSSSKKSSSDGGGDSGDVAGSIASNHGHSVVITEAELTADEAVTLTLTGGTHEHSLDLTMAQVTDIADGVTVTKTSSETNSHTHDVTFN